MGKIKKLLLKFRLWWRYTWIDEKNLSNPVQYALRNWRLQYKGVTVYKALKRRWLRFSKKGVCVTALGNKNKTMRYSRKKRRF